MFSRFKKPEGDSAQSPDFGHNPSTFSTSQNTAAPIRPQQSIEQAPQPAVHNIAPQPVARFVQPMSQALATQHAQIPPANAARSPIENAYYEKDKKRKDFLAQIKQKLHNRLLESLNLSALEQATEASLKSEISAITSEAIEELSISLAKEERQMMIQDLYDEVMGLGPLETLLRDETVSDILVNGAKNVFVERGGKLTLSDVTFHDERHLYRIIDKIVSAVGRRVDESNPYCDARLPDGSRFNVMVPPVAVDGSLVSIRKFKKDKLNIHDLVRFGAFTEEMAMYLQAAVACRLNIIVSGGTGSGKTTTLNALSSYIDDSERVLTIEDTAELQLQQLHVGRMESRPPNMEGKGAVTQRDCLRNALRMRPDRIIVGETRGEEVIDMLQAMNTGHDGSMTTIHANSARDGISRLENMVAMAGIEMPLKAVRKQIASAVNVIVQASRLQDGTRRMTSITEITGMEGEVISMQELFRYERLGIEPNGKIIGRFNATGVRSHYSDRFRQWGYDLPGTIFDPVI
jgi:pilus assembly protein CpaF